LAVRFQQVTSVRLRHAFLWTTERESDILRAVHPGHLLIRRSQLGSDARMTTRRLLWHLAFMGLLPLSPSTSPAQEATALRIRWEADPPVHGLQTVCGRVFNDGSADARRIRVRVEGLDERGGVTGRREGDVLGRVSPGDIGLFCISLSAGAATYRVTIVGTEWVVRPEAP
jgi:hypothetical protein